MPCILKVGISKNLVFPFQNKSGWLPIWKMWHCKKKFYYKLLCKIHQLSCYSHFVSLFCHQLAALAPSSPNREMAYASPVQPTAVPAQVHPVFAPVETVTIAQTPILQTLRVPVSKDCFQLTVLNQYVWKSQWKCEILLLQSFWKQQLLCGYM